MRIVHNDQTAEVDEGIADLILACWKAGFPTLRSCQGTEGSGLFPHVALDPSYIASFCESIAQANGELDEWGIRHVFGRLWPDTHETAWQYGLSPDWDYDYEAEGHPSNNQIIFGAAVAFPRADLPEIIRRLDLLTKARAAK